MASPQIFGSRRRQSRLGFVALAAATLAATLAAGSAFAADPIGTSVTFSPDAGSTLSGELIVWQGEVLANRTTNGFTAFSTTGVAASSPIVTGAPVKLMTTFNNLLLWVDNANNVKTSNPGGTVSSLGAIAPSADQLLTVGTQLWVARSGGIDRYAPTSSALGGASPVSYAAGATIRMAIGGDGNVWVTEKTGAVDTLTRWTTTGAVVGSPLNFASSAADPSEIVLGGDGAIWILFSGTNSLGRFDPSGTFAETALPSGAGARNLVAAPGGVWYNENGLNNVARMTTTSGAFVRTTTSAPSAFGLKGLVVGPDANLWTVGLNVNKIGKFGTLAPTTTVASTTVPATTILATTTTLPAATTTTTAVPTTVKQLPPPTVKAKRVCTRYVTKRVKVKGKFVRQRVCTRYRIVQ
jgi:streptogramin lyase